VCDHEFKTDVTFKKVCILCGQIFKDMDTYIFEACKDINVKSVIDVGTGLKGVVAENFWRQVKHIEKGWAVDIWKIKPSDFWKPINDDALKLESYFSPKSVDVIQAFGFLEHLKKDEGYRFIEIAEKIARELVIISAATEVHGPTRDYKVKIDGNIYHYYWSTWHWQEFEKLGYQTNYVDMTKGLTFMTEVVAWKYVK